MRATPETLLIGTMSLFALAGVTAVYLDDVGPDEAWPIDVTPIDVVPIELSPRPSIPATVDAAAWFQSIRQYCNPVEVETRLRWQPAPDSENGSMHEAACYALAGKIDHARRVIESLPRDRQYHAAGVVFNAGHPAADAGDELAAGPLMELVVEFWPNHYQALYHAGASSYQRGDYLASERYLTRFLEEYSTEDGFWSNAQAMLEAMGA